MGTKFGTVSASGVEFYSVHGSLYGPPILFLFLDLNEIYIEKCRDVYNFRQRVIRVQHLLAFYIFYHTSYLDFRCDILPGLRVQNVNFTTKD